ncbi:hypothetical protein B0H16DRAFT_1726516 [Mycena metata]|uniref:Protein kinase domain-containing protein n=1 Tax=Mycena metata TaxID=1033252 RepID=A0AAD7INQ4_9AGAR|nr:hypothetical protein B0H16DRAFT_1726516 [Mycena metata]
MRSCTYFPYINTVREFTEFLQQMLEGLVFLHYNNIAHRAISKNHMVLDASRDQSVPHWKSRTVAGPMKYYFIDFGLSVQFPSRDARKLVTGVSDLIPEVSDTVPYDPFKVDVWFIAGFIVDYLEILYAGLDYLVPLARKLRHHDPTRRPDARDALKLFQSLVSKMSEEELKEPLDYKLHDSNTRRAILSMMGLEV